MPRRGDTPRIAILGAGFAGLGMAMRLVQAGITSFVVYEKAESIGGTWRDNTYPGLSCDVPSHLYCFSFGPDATWTRRYPPQEEVLGYLRHCVDSFALKPHLRLGVEIATAEFDDEAGTWELRTAEGDRIEADVIVSGLGQLNRPKMPDIRGADEFAGTAFHSARWNHEHDLTGRTVAVIGNGSSAAQFVPRIAPHVERLYLFQRTPSWIAPKNDYPYPRWARRVLAVRPLRLLYRMHLYARQEMLYLPIRSRLAGRFARRWANQHRRAQVGTTALYDRLTPDYPMGCKRVVMSDDFYPSTQRDNVELVTTPIDRMTGDGIRTVDGGTIAADTVIYGTGFRATEFLVPLRITGRAGRELDEAWRGGARAYLGMAVPGFPNLFLLYGPNTNLGHNSIVLMIERQIDYVLRCVQLLAKRQLAWMDVRAHAMANDDARTQRAVSRTVWNGGCTSWYKTEDGRVTNNWPHSTVRYWRVTRRPRLADFELHPRVGR